MTEHVPKYVCEAGLIDIFKCSCGWESRPYYDGAEFAQDEWKKHVKDEEMKLLSRLQEQK